MAVTTRKTWKLTSEQKMAIGKRYEAGEGTRQLAREFGVSEGGILYTVRCLEIPRRNRRPGEWLRPDELPIAIRSCFNFSRQGLRPYSDHLCLCIERTCSKCGEIRFVPVSRVRINPSTFTGMCKKCREQEPVTRRSGAAHARWNGGRQRSAGGYIYVSAPDHPDATASGYIAEHRLVMEQVLGRRLLRSESVHHLNGIRDDNRPENLELWTRVQPAGIRANDAPHCLTCTCHVPTPQE